MSGAILVFLEPNTVHADFDEWRRTAFDAIPGVTQKEILRSGSDVQEPAIYSYMNFYEVSSIHLITNSVIKDLLSSSSADEHISQSYWQIYSHLTSSQRPGLGLNKISPFMLVSVGFTIKENLEALEDFHGWYTKEHMPGMATVPGWRRGSRYALLKTFGGKPEYAAPFLAVHQWDEENGLGGDIWKKVVFTPWTNRILESQIAPMHRRTWNQAD